MKYFSSTPSPTKNEKSLCLKVLHSTVMDDGFVDRFNQGDAWRVHSIFRRTLNLVSQTRSMVTLASRENTLMPYTAICTASDFSVFSHLINEAVDTQDRSLRIGSEFVLKLDGKLRSSRYKPFTVLNDQVTLRFHARYLEGLYQQRRVSGSFSAKTDASRFELEMQKTLINRTHLFCHSVSNMQGQAIVEHGRSLIGLGVGLTPSGDDYLVGFFAAILLNKNCAFKKVVAPFQAIVVNAQEYTNEISATYLQSAVQFRFKTEIVNLVEAVLCLSESQVKKALLDLLSIGATSGSDIARGVIDAFNICNYYRG